MMMAIAKKIGRPTCCAALRTTSIRSAAVNARPGEIRVRQSAIGVNFTDVHGRRGDYAPLRAMPMPLVLGMEAAGVVEALGEGVERFRVGDRVAYASVPLGAYCDVRNFPAERCVSLPAGVSDRAAAAVLLKGLTVQMLVRRVFREIGRASCRERV